MQKEKFMEATPPHTTPRDTTNHPPQKQIRPLVMNVRDAAAYLNVSPSTLNKWRVQGIGPAFIRVNKLRKYRLADLEAYVQKQMEAR
jgi:hypothetical protein